MSEELTYAEMQEKLEELQAENETLKADKPSKIEDEPTVKMYIFKPNAEPNEKFFGYTPTRLKHGYYSVDIPESLVNVERRRQFGRFLTEKEYQADVEAFEEQLKIEDELKAELNEE